MSQLKMVVKKLRNHKVLNLNNDFLDQVGLGGMLATDKPMFLEYLEERLQLKIGERIAREVSPPVLEEFERFMKEGDQIAAETWIKRNCPDYAAIVEEESANLVRDVETHKAEILRG